MADDRICDKCHKQIRTRHVELAGYAYHADCFTCSECHSKLDEHQATKDSKGRLKCAACAQAMCRRCNKNILLGQRGFEVGKYHYHDPDCITCADCHAPIPKGSMSLKHPTKDDIFCEVHMHE